MEAFCKLKKKGIPAELLYSKEFYDLYKAEKELEKTRRNIKNT
jgi:hypothetical protein